jgi:ComF family protein
LKRILSGLADIVFPPQCLTCEEILDSENNTTPLCPACFSAIHFIQPPLCPCCGIPFAGAGGDNHLCGECLLSKPLFSVARAVGHYETKLLEAIHSFKYKGKISTGEALGKIMADFAYPAFHMADYSLIIPVPLHSKRLRERGFNQALILAREISRKFLIPLDFLTLRRHMYTDAQINLGRKDREANVKGVFSVRDSEKIQGQRIILVDDVYTSGSTARECTRILMRNNAESVAILTLARTV